MSEIMIAACDATAKIVVDLCQIDGTLSKCIFHPFELNTFNNSTQPKKYNHPEKALKLKVLTSIIQLIITSCHHLKVNATVNLLPFGHQLCKSVDANLAISLLLPLKSLVFIFMLTNLVTVLHIPKAFINSIRVTCKHIFFHLQVTHKIAYLNS